MKILIAIENKQDQIELINILNENKIKSVKLTRAVTLINFLEKILLLQYVEIYLELIWDF